MDERDRTESTPVLMINETMARHIWPEGPAGTAYCVGLADSVFRWNETPELFEPVEDNVDFSRQMIADDVAIVHGAYKTPNGTGHFIRTLVKKDGSWKVAAIQIAADPS